MFWETSQSFIFAVARLQRMKTLGAMFKKVTMVPLIIRQTLESFLGARRNQQWQVNREGSSFWRIHLMEPIVDGAWASPAQTIF